MHLSFLMFKKQNATDDQDTPPDYSIGWFVLKPCTLLMSVTSICVIFRMQRCMLEILLARYGEGT